MVRNTAENRLPGLKLKHWFWLLVLVPGIPFAAGSLLVVAYSNIPLPMEDKVAMKPLRDGVTELIMLVHGKGDTPASWAAGFADELAAVILDEQQQAVTVDWGKYSGDLFRSTLNGRRIGQALGKKISAHKGLKRLHLVGHSAGSFVVYGICEAVKDSGAEISVHSTYLDPVSIYGGIDWGFGVRRFGDCGDVSDAYIDREDGIPGSNGPLRYIHTFDVTALKKEAGFTGSPHLWPIEYYRKKVLEGKLPFWEPTETVLQRYPPEEMTIM